MRTLTDPMQAPMGAGSIGSFGLSCVGLHISSVNFILFVPGSLALGSQRECGFWWNTGLTIIAKKILLNSPTLKLDISLESAGVLGSIHPLTATI